MRPADEDLMAYADGELSGERQSEIEDAIESEPELLEIIEQHRAMRAAAKAAFAGAETAPMSDGLDSLVIQMRTDISAEDVEDAGAQSGNAARILWPLAAAATFVIGVMGSQLTQAPADNRNVLIASQDGRPIAGKVLASALSELPVAVQQASIAGSITIDVSFISSNDQYCRQFHIRNDGLTGGIACRQDGAWQVITLADMPQGPDGQYHTAGAEGDPLAVTAARLGVEKKLSPGEEAELIEQGWK